MKLTIKRRDVKPGEVFDKHILSGYDMADLWKLLETQLPLTDDDWIVHVELNVIAERVIGNVGQPPVKHE